MLDVSEVLRRHAVAAAAQSWLDGLPELVRDLERRWDLVVGRTLDGATEAFVAEAVTAGGRPVVLKLVLPQGDGAAARHETTALRLGAGRGTVALLDADPHRGALLLERLGRPMIALGLPTGERHALLCDTVARVWRPAPGADLPTGADRARHLAAFVTQTWEDLGHPCSERAVEHAVACAGRREAAHDDERAVLVHGDVHQLNALEAGSGFRLVDPDGVLAEPECDLGTVMRGDPVDLLQGDPVERAHRLAARTGTDPVAVWEWGVVERVASGLHCTAIGLQPLGCQTLAAADAVAGLGA
ncbi:aminoglycoside phosphotransferase family protein [Kineococcus sp. NPDC059986]|uniref:aminoglycoside phosphotransferase family protein n=1 Tax=Kineococcus sp. NPDC059986 TaxID=3155538 RepID=UPI00344DDB4D